MEIIAKYARQYKMDQTLTALDQNPGDKDRLLVALAREIGQVPMEAQHALTEAVMGML